MNVSSTSPCRCNILVCQLSGNWFTGAPQLELLVECILERPACIRRALHARKGNEGAKAADTLLWLVTATYSNDTKSASGWRAKQDALTCEDAPVILQRRLHASGHRGHMITLAASRQQIVTDVNRHLIYSQHGFGHLMSERVFRGIKCLIWKLIDT